jgi:hypothetical protein
MIAGGQDELTETGGPHHCIDEVGSRKVDYLTASHGESLPALTTQPR